MGAGPLLFVPVQRRLGISWRYNGEKHAHFGGLMVESMFIFVFYGEIHAHFGVLGVEIR